LYFETQFAQTLEAKEDDLLNQTQNRLKENKVIYVELILSLMSLDSLFAF